MLENVSKVKECSYVKCLVANSFLEAGTIVQKYEGNIILWEEVPNNEINYAILINEKEWMIIKTDARYINHSCDRNCIINEELEVITTRPVNKGEELNVKYNIVYQNENPGMWDSR